MHDIQDVSKRAKDSSGLLLNISTVVLCIHKTDSEPVFSVVTISAYVISTMNLIISQTLWNWMRPLLIDSHTGQPLTNTALWPYSYWILTNTLIKTLSYADSRNLKLLDQAAPQSISNRSQTTEVALQQEPHNQKKASIPLEHITRCYLVPAGEGAVGHCLAGILWGDTDALQLCRDMAPFFLQRPCQLLKLCLLLFDGGKYTGSRLHFRVIHGFEGPTQGESGCKAGRCHGGCENWRHTEKGYEGRRIPSLQRTRLGDKQGEREKDRS